jgi:hypothetical protein
VSWFVVRGGLSWFFEVKVFEPFGPDRSLIFKTPEWGAIMAIAKFAGRTGAAVLTLLVVGALAQPTRADPQGDHKAKFKDGCKSSNGSWIENPDGSYQCNTRGGETNVCFKDTPPKPCVHKKL